MDLLWVKCEHWNGSIDCLDEFVLNDTIYGLSILFIYPSLTNPDYAFSFFLISLEISRLIEFVPSESGNSRECWNFLEKVIRMVESDLCHVSYGSYGPR